MNSDSHESAAWRAFGMLDADETAAFDSAMRQDSELKDAYREIENLTAAVAAVTTIPIAPRAGQLESLHLRLGIGVSRRTNWLGISGWAAAAALMAFLAVNRRPDVKHEIVGNAVSDPLPSVQHPPQKIDPQPNELIVQNPGSVDLITSEVMGGEDSSPTHPTEPSPPIVRAETKRLIQEIEVLREELEDFQERDRERFEVVPDMAWPIVMRMTSPRSGVPLIKENEAPPLTAMLADALTAASDVSADGSIARNSPPVAYSGAEPSAIPIYDAARDIGTLYIDNLPASTDEEPYILWVTTEGSKQPVRVGKLPKSGNHKSESFDFNLGAPATIPTAFILTRGQRGQSESPSAANTVLRGPSRK